MQLFNLMTLAAMEPLDWGVIGVYFAVIGFVAWWYGRGQKDTDDFFLAGRNAGWVVIGASIFTSNIGSEHIVGLAGQGAATDPPEALTKLPVARAVWRALPDLPTAAAAWIHAGGSHLPVFSQALTTEHCDDLAEMPGVELAVIDGDARLREFKNQLRAGS